MVPAYAPGVSDPDRLTRLIRSAVHTFEQQLYETTLASEKAEPAPEETLPNPLQHLRMDPGRVGLATMLEEMANDYARSPRQYYPDQEIIPIKAVVAPKWREFVVEKEDDGTEKVNRLNYEVCVLQALREKIRVREIWVVGAKRIKCH